MRRAARRDATEEAIVSTLRKLGCTVEYLSGAGMPDLLVGRAGTTYLLEVKAPGGAVRPGQEEWHASWRGRPVVVVWTPAEALRAVGLAR